MNRSVEYRARKNARYSFALSAFCCLSFITTIAFWGELLFWRFPGIWCPHFMWMAYMWMAYASSLGMIIARQLGVAADRKLKPESKFPMEHKLTLFSQVVGVFAYVPFVILSVYLLMRLRYVFLYL